MVVDAIQRNYALLTLLSLCTLTRKLIFFIAHICFVSTMLKYLLWNFQLRGFRDEYGVVVVVVVVFDLNDANDLNTQQQQQLNINEYGNTTGKYHRTTYKQIYRLAGTQ